MSRSTDTLASSFRSERMETWTPVPLVVRALKPRLPTTTSYVAVVLIAGSVADVTVHASLYVEPAFKVHSGM